MHSEYQASIHDVNFDVIFDVIKFCIPGSNLNTNGCQIASTVILCYFTVVFG